MLLPASSSAQLKSIVRFDSQSKPRKHTLVCMDVSTGPGILAGLLGFG